MNARAFPHKRSVCAADLDAALMGGTDGFMMKLDTNLTILYGTYFGGAHDDRINGIARYADRFAAGRRTVEVMLKVRFGGLLRDREMFLEQRDP